MAINEMKEMGHNHGPEQGDCMALSTRCSHFEAQLLCSLEDGEGDAENNCGTLIMERAGRRQDSRFCRQKIPMTRETVRRYDDPS